MQGVRGVIGSVGFDGQTHYYLCSSGTPASAQTAVGLQAAGVREPKAAEDLAKQAKDTVELSEAAQNRVATVQPPEPPLPERDALSASKVLPPEGEHLDKSV